MLNLPCMPSYYFQSEVTQFQTKDNQMTNFDRKASDPSAYKAFIMAPQVSMESRFSSTNDIKQT